MIKFCYLCQTPLTNKNSSLEHVIPNALGGKLKATILCKKCNNDSGSFCDNSLAKSLSPFSNMINHSRDHGKVQPEEVTVDGVSTKILPGGQGFLSKISFDKETNTYKIFGSKNIEAKAQGLFQKLHERHKITTEHYEKITSSLSENIKTIQNPIVKFSVTFENIWLGVLKIAINFAIYNHISPTHIQEAINILQKKDQKLARQVSTYYYTDAVHPVRKGSIFHSLALIGAPDEKILYCLISLYGILQTIVILSTNYKGPTLKKIYVYDTWNEEEHLPPDTPFPNFTREQMTSLFSPKKSIEIAPLEICLDRFLSHFIRHTNDLSKEIIEDLVQFLINETTKEAIENTKIFTQPELSDFIYKKSVEYKDKHISQLKLVKNIHLKNNSKKLSTELYDIYLNEKAKHHICTKAINFIAEKIFTPGVPDGYFFSTDFYNDLLSFILENTSHLPFHKNIVQLATLDNIKEQISPLQTDNFFHFCRNAASHLPPEFCDFFRKNKDLQQITQTKDAHQ